MEILPKGKLELYQFSNLKQYNTIAHFVTGRKGGFSKGAFASFNTGFHVGDNDWHVLQNRKMLAHSLGVDLGQFTFAAQTHSSNVALIDHTKKGLGGVDCESAIANTDALVSKTAGIYICIQVADCVPILLYDRANHVVAAIHAGWRGTVRKITEATIRKMMYAYETHPADIMVGIGPSNGPCCYEVGEDVKKEVAQSTQRYCELLKPGPEPGKYYFNQWQANFLQLLHCGVPEQNIEMAGACSQCQCDTFYSSRKDKGVTGRTTAGIMIKKHPSN